jgi:hypothetical protein
VTNHAAGPAALVLSELIPQELAGLSTDGVCSGGCSGGETVTWDLGLVDGGANVTKQLVGHTFAAASGPPGEVVHDAARATKSGFEARASRDLRVSP